MMMTNSRMMVTRQPIRTGVLPSSGGTLADGLVAVEEFKDLDYEQFPTSYSGLQCIYLC